MPPKTTPRTPVHADSSQCWPQSPVSWCLTLFPWHLSSGDHLYPLALVVCSDLFVLSLRLTNLKSPMYTKSLAGRAWNMENCPSHSGLSLIYLLPSWYQVARLCLMA